MELVLNIRLQLRVRIVCSIYRQTIILHNKSENRYGENVSPLKTSPKGCVLDIQRVTEENESQGFKKTNGRQYVRRTLISSRQSSALLAGRKPDSYNIHI